jgi:VanZ family protein
MTVLQGATSKTKAYAPALAWALIIFIESSVPSSAIPKYVIFSQDKLIHMAIYALLAVLLYRGIRMRAPTRWEFAAWVTFVVCVVYGASDEFHQYFVPGRSMEVFDWIADAIGAALAIAMVRAFERWRDRRTGGGAPSVR